MSIFIAVVSHGHSKLIQRLACLSKLAQKYTVVVKINKNEQGLVSYLKDNKISYIDDLYGIGFGHNNNVVYKYCKKYLSMKDEDYFLVFNPDVISDDTAIDNLIELMINDSVNLAGVNLFKDPYYSISDNSIRNFPSYSQFVRSFLGMVNTSIINKKLIKKPTKVDWAAGSFLAFKVSHYSRLKGFDEGYFMYCEDIDICYRSHLIGEQVVFYPKIKMQHLAEHQNRSIFSKHFYWHVSSVFRFLLTKHRLTCVKSSL
ncbi:glycosyltransferase family 2 protein [Colwellia sp. MB02u-14]|uniref:glycosyltransferase family 2 protein n=1 Tax=Colwellia sp. MB02u-14 TaxID=2759815 RepID=UPI0015F567A5|nr:glycosyltransferase family 2 protein [Colwellia sp. MB02u-14]MBA6303750.1 glycosyltransferase family 2 protein [Colwellia sp. MB02u-14]